MIDSNQYHELVDLLRKWAQENDEQRIELDGGETIDIHEVVHVIDTQLQTINWDNDGDCGWVEEIVDSITFDPAIDIAEIWDVIRFQSDQNSRSRPDGSVTMFESSFSPDEWIEADDDDMLFAEYDPEIQMIHDGKVHYKN